MYFGCLRGKGDLIFWRAWWVGWDGVFTDYRCYGHCSGHDMFFSSSYAQGSLEINRNRCGFDDGGQLWSLDLYWTSPW